MPEVMKKTETRGLRKEGGADKNILKQTESLATVTQRMGYTIAAEEIVKDLVFQVVERDIQKDKVRSGSSRLGVQEKNARSTESQPIFEG